VRRLFRLYADNLRRLATAESQLYLAQNQQRWQDSGLDESELMRFGSEVGRRVTPLVGAMRPPLLPQWVKNSDGRCQAAEA
jgi:hypothetical protein